MMKTKVLLFLGAMMLTMSSCKIDLGNNLKPSDNIAEADYPQAAFDKVDSHVVGSVKLVQSDKSHVTISAPDNYIELFRIKNKDGELDIRFANNNMEFSTSDILITIYTPTLKEIENAGAGDIRLDSLRTEKLKVKNSGVGAFRLNRVIARKIDVSCSGVGSININGEADEAEYSCSGVGGIQAQDMKAREVSASVSGVGGIDCYASEAIEGNVSGVGGLKYAGHPAKKQLHHSMTGGISEI